MANPVSKAVAWIGSTVRDYVAGPSFKDRSTWSSFGWSPTSTGMVVSEASALSYSPFWSAVSIISRDVAKLPLVVDKVDANGNKRRYTEHPLYELLHDSPNPEMTSVVFREALQAHALTWGNAFAEIERDPLNRPIALWPITPDRVTPKRTDTGRLFYRVTNPGGGEVNITPANMLHVPGLSFDGFFGYSVVQKARESIGLGIATERFGGSFFGNGSTFGGVLSHPGKLSPEAKGSIRESVDAIHSGVDRAHKFLIVAEGMKYDPIGIPPNNAQFNETRKLQIEEAARWFSIPQHKLNQHDRATFSNIEHLDLDYYRSCLLGWLVRWEQEYRRKLIPRLERYQMSVRHIVEGMLRGDTAARTAHYNTMFMIGAYSINDILELEDRNKIGAEGDVHYVPGNMLPADRAMEGPPKELPPANVKVIDQGNVEDEDDRALKSLLSEIAANTAALQSSMAAEREAMSLAERDRHQAEVTRLENARAMLQLSCEELRTQHAVETERLTHAATQAQAETETERRAKDAIGVELLEARERSTTLFAEKEAIRVRAEADLADVITRLQTIEQERSTSRDETAAERTAREQAQAEVADLARKLPALEHAAEEARMLASHAATTAAEVEQKIQERRAAELDRLTRVVTAHRGLIVHAVSRQLQAEVDRARRRAGSTQSLTTWVDSFYQNARDVYATELVPAIATHLAWKGSDEDPHDAARVLANDHCDESVRQLRAIVDEAAVEDFHTALERLLTRWEQERPNKVADKVLHDELVFIATYE